VTVVGVRSEVGGAAKAGDIAGPGVGAAIGFGAVAISPVFAACAIAALP
jgi:hypothetical protein